MVMVEGRGERADGDGRGHLSSLQPTNPSGSVRRSSDWVRNWLVCIRVGPSTHRGCNAFSTSLGWRLARTVVVGAFGCGMPPGSQPPPRPPSPSNKTGPQNRHGDRRRLSAPQGKGFAGGSTRPSLAQALTPPPPLATDRPPYRQCYHHRVDPSRHGCGPPGSFLH